MTTSVIHIRDRQPGDVYIGRAGKGEDGYFGNPVRIGERCFRCGDTHHNGHETLPCFRLYFNKRIETDPVFRCAVLQLAGKRLVCFCKPRACHGDVIAEWIDSQ